MFYKKLGNRSFFPFVVYCAFSITSIDLHPINRGIFLDEMVPDLVYIEQIRPVDLLAS